MIAQNTKQITLSIPLTLKVTGLASGTLGVLGIVLTVLAYAPGHPGFLPFTTYLSEMGATPVWPQILWNAAMLINAPLRYLVLVLLVLRLLQLGAGSRMAWAVLIVGVLSPLGTIIMSAVPLNMHAEIHELGIPVYFFGVVILQTLIGIQEWKLKAVPRLLPALSFAVVASYLLFFVLMMLYMAGSISRTVPVFPEWICAAVLLVWVFAHSLILGQEMEN